MSLVIKMTLGALLLAKVLLVLWGVNRGFDLGDGGFFLLNLNRPAESPPLFEFYKLLLLLEPRPRFDAIDARLIRIAVEAVATLALVHGVWVWARARLPRAAGAGFLGLLLFTGLGTFLSVAAREFGYNDATNLLTFAATACTFRLLALPAGPAAQPRRLLWAAGAGALLGLQLFVKFPATLLLSLLFAALVLGVLRATGRQRAALLAVHGLGVVLATSVFVASNGGVTPLLDKWAHAQEVNRVTGYSVPEILRVYLWHDWGSHVNSFRATLAFGVTLLGARWLLRGRADALDVSLASALAVATAVLCWGVWDFHASNVHPWLLALFCASGLLTLLCWVLAWRAWRPAPEAPATGRWEALAPPLLLAALPFVEMAGTNVALTLRLPTHVAPLFLLLALLLGELLSSGQRWFPAGAGVLMAVLSCLVFTSHHLERPYGLPMPLHRQVHRVEGLPGMRVDGATRTFLEDLRARLERGGYRPGDPVVALDFMPGLVHYLDARSPGFPFFPFDRVEQNCWALNRADEDEVPFLILGQSMSIRQRDCIRAFDFPNDFVELGTIRNPWEYAIPYFFGGPPMPYVTLAGPRDAARRPR